MNPTFSIIQTSRFFDCDTGEVVRVEVVLTTQSTGDHVITLTSA